ncbi:MULTISPECIES: alpha/beta fold hydrolase [unclassified Blastococcus]
MAVRTTPRGEPRAGTFPNGMEYLTWGDGPRTLLMLPGGPGSSVPSGLVRRATLRWSAPLVSAGYTVWLVTRRRHMPAGHGVPDIADDYAGLVAEEFGGSVHLVVGESYGGMVAQHLAAAHPSSAERVALVVAGCEVNAWGKAVDRRLADALLRGDRTGAGAAFAEYVLPGDRWRAVRRLLGPLVARSALSATPTEDLVVELESELTFDSRAVLPRITAPVLLICGDRDQFFTREVVRETAELIPDCRLTWYPGAGHVRAASSRQVARDVLAFAP